MKNKKRIGALCLMLLASAIWGGSTVFAIRIWCSGDPVFEINGEERSITIELAPYDIGEQITEEDPVQVTLIVPEGVEAELKELGGDFPEEVTIIRMSNSSKIRVDVDVPNLPDLERIRVTVEDEEGEILAQLENGGPHVTVKFPIPED
jgi:hypothetical protein